MASVGETVSNASKLLRSTLGAALGGVRAGEDRLTIHTQGTGGAVSLSSTSFADGGPIPDRYTPQGENRSPQLSWTGVPEGTKELVLLVADPAAPFPGPFIHWFLLHLPATLTSLPEALPVGRELPQVGGAIQAMNDAKTQGYFGPQPPLGHGVHHYHFQLFAVDVPLNLGTSAIKDDLMKALAGHILADGEIVGTYEMKK